MARSSDRKSRAEFHVFVLSLLALASCAPTTGGQIEPLVGDVAPESGDGAQVASIANTVGRSQIRSRGAVRFEQLLQGRLPGVKVLQSDNGDFLVRIRGVNTFSGNTNPLFLLDGMPIESATLLNINPADVQRIEVIKDGTAAFYGSRGGNGVILITTIRPGESTL